MLDQALAGLEVAAHALVGKRDIPIPEWLFAWAAGLVLIFSFVGLSIAWQRTRFERPGWREGSAVLSRVLLNPVTEVLCGLLSVGLLVLTVYSGLNGTEAIDRNFSVTFVFVTVWLGFAFLSPLFGDFFRAFNPWRAVARATGGLFRLIAGQSPPAPVAYPERLGRWPAAIGIFAFVWLELAYGAPGFQVVGLTPHTVAVATLVYTAYTFVAMALFGSEKWLERGEAFSVYFSMFASLSPVEVRNRRIGWRRPLSGASGWVAAATGSLALVLITIGSTTYDGASEGMLAGAVEWMQDGFQDLGFGPTAAVRTTGTIFLAGAIAFVSALYWAGIYGMHTVRSSFSTRDLGRRFAHAFIPIALAYLVAHYFSLVVFQEQAQFTYLLSDPLGDGSDIFGTATSGIDFNAISADAVWYVQVATLVTGHVIALVLGHDRALAVYGDSRLAARSQYWMLALMVAFTSLGLFLLSQSNQ